MSHMHVRAPWSMRHAWHRMVVDTPVRPSLAAPAAASLLAIIVVLSVAAGEAGKATGNSYYCRYAVFLTTARPSAPSTRVQEQQARRSELLSSRTVLRGHRDTPARELRVAESRCAVDDLNCVSRLRLYEIKCASIDVLSELHLHFLRAAPLKSSRSRRARPRFAVPPGTV